MSRTAICACGATSITIGGEPVQYNICHCTNCKRRTGSAFGISTYFEHSELIEQVGDTYEYAFHNAERNHDQVRHFCKRCGTTLFWFVSSLPGQIGIAGGCFPDGSLGEPLLAKVESKRLDWVAIPSHWTVTG